MNCQCEPHASGSNRCMFCKAEAREHDRLYSAVRVIRAIAKNEKADPSATCDAWLERNGFDCEASRRRQREQRAVQLDAEIERLRKEREAL